jgi:hypothetical protein
MITCNRLSWSTEVQQDLPTFNRLADILKLFMRSCGTEELKNYKLELHHFVLYLVRYGSFANKEIKHTQTNSKTNDSETKVVSPLKLQRLGHLSSHSSLIFLPLS